MLFQRFCNGIYKSTDGGATFQRMLKGFPSNINVTAGMFLSTDRGVSWVPINRRISGMPDT